jgi:hypothetical protein
MQTISLGIETCGSKIISATKFIDFFVHDILDYTLLNQDSNKFTKDITTFNVKECIEEIITIQEDKIDLKNIFIKTSFKGFEGSGKMIRTDMKRL